MKRALAAVVILGCGGSKHAPAPAPPPPAVTIDAGIADAAPPPDGPAVAEAGSAAGSTTAPSTLAMREPETERHAAVPKDDKPHGTVSIGKLSIFGTIDSATATAVIRKFRGRILYCYETARLRDPKLEGTVTLELAVEMDGKVSSATASGVDAGIDECLKHGALTMAFPAGKKTAKISVPLAFQTP